MIKMKARSWALLITLALVLAFAAGVRQGYIVSEQNRERKDASIAKQGVTNTQKENPRLPPLRQVTDPRCQVTYILPESVATDSGEVSVLCDAPASDEAQLRVNHGYRREYVSSPSGQIGVWIKAQPDLQMLISRTLKLLQAHE